MALGYLRILCLLFCAALALPASAQVSGCRRTCGSTAVPYPFGFSAGCGIPLNCTDSSPPAVRIDSGVLVRNITSDAILVDVPPSCDRPMRDADAFFGRSYALTWRNGILLRDCSASATASACAVPPGLLSSGGGCGSAGDNVSCLTGGTEGSGGEFFTLLSIIGAGCGSLFTAIGYDDSGGGAAVPSLALRTAELGWWLEGTCRCAAQANCTALTSPVTGGPAFRCRCLDGFEGDGFADGGGCRKETARKCDPSKYLSGTCGGPNRVGLLIGGMVVGASITAAAAFACYLTRLRCASRYRKSSKHLLSQASSMVPLYTYRDIERATNGFSESLRLGTGAYGTVYAGKLGDNKFVAIKKIKHRSGDADGVEQVMNEIKLLSSVSHPNLVRLLGCCIEGGEQILVYEFMPNGTLAQHLQRERGAPLPWTVRLTIAAETAKAIAYLHSAINPPIYHRDIKSSNILLDYNYNSKVADFGLSRMGMTTELSHISTAPQGTPGYVDPQYHQNFHLSDKSDVYSFGVVLTEILTALKVVDFGRAQGDVNLAALAVDRIGKGCVDEIIDPCLEPHRDAWTLSSLHKVAELAFRCLAFHRDMRPSMMEVADELEQIRLSAWAPTSDDNLQYLSTAASSLRSSPSNVTDKSRAMSKSRRLALPAAVLEEVKKVDSSPVSVQDSWFSEQSSPSANSLLANAAH